MRFWIRVTLASLCMGWGLASPSEAASPFADFLGKYNLRGTGELFQENKRLGAGKVRLNFFAKNRGRTGNLTILGNLEIGGRQRPIRTRAAFQVEGRSALTNLAPGYEDGRSAIGTYTINGRQITGAYPFGIRTTVGTVTVAAKVRTAGKRRVLTVTQTLVSSTLAAPLVWRFTARTR